MPVFFTHLHNGHGYQIDVDGADFPTLDAVQAHVVRAGADILAEEIKEGCRRVQLTFHIEDEQHNWLMEVPMSASVEIEI